MEALVMEIKAVIDGVSSWGAANKGRIILTVVIILAVAGYMFWAYTSNLKRQIATLDAQLAASQLALEAAQKETAEKKAALEAQEEVSLQLADKHIQKIKEVARNATRKGLAMPSSDILPRTNALIERARRSNAEWQ